MREGRRAVLHDMLAALLPALRDLAPTLRYRVDDLDPAAIRRPGTAPAPRWPVWR